MGQAKIPKEQRCVNHANHGFRDGGGQPARRTAPGSVPQALPGIATHGADWRGLRD